MSLKISDLEALNTVTIGQSGFTPRLQVIGSNTGGLAEIYVSAGSGNALRLNTNFVYGNYIDINPYITGVSNGGFEINQNGTQRLVITAGGNIGIGTTTDAGYKVNVSGTIAATSAPGSYGTIIRIRDTVTSGTESFGGVHFTSSPGTDYTIGKWSTAAGAGLLQIRDQAGNQFVTVNGIGNFGVGTNSPGVKFVNSGGGNSDGPTFGSGSVGCNAILSGNGLYGLYTGVSNSGHVWQQVQRNDGSTAVYPLSLQTSGGSVLIGATTDAGYKLDVNGSIRVGGGSLIYFNTTGSPGSNLIGTVNDFWLTLQCNRGNASRIDLTNGSGILFTDNSAERMSIASTGIKINNLAGTGTRLVTANASGVLSTTAGDAAPRYSSYVIVSHSSYTNICTINGDALASAIKMSFQGTSGGTVVNTTAEILVNHYQDISITSNSGFYSQLNIRIISNNNESYSIEAQVIGATTPTGLNIEVFPLNNEAVTFQGTLVTPGTTLIHTTRSGIYITGTGGNQGDISAGGSVYAGETIVSNGNATFGNTANRRVNYDSNGGNFRIKANAGGWATGYFFDGSSGTFRGGFGGYGGADTLGYYWIGSDYNIPTMVVQPNEGYVGVGTVSPTRKLHVVSSDNEGIFMEKSTTGGHWFNFRSADSNLWSMGAQPGLMGWYNRTDSTYKAVITDSGNFLIGTTTDAGYKLQVNGSVRSTSGYSFEYGGGIYAVNYTYNNVLLTGYDPSAGDFVDFYTPGSGVSNATKKIRILNNGTTTFYGNVYAPAFFNSSDIRLKEIVDYDYNISDIKPISYLWKDLRDNKKHIGYSAQDVQKVMPDAVNEDADGMLSVNYIEVLVAKIAELENRIKQLEK